MSPAGSMSYSRNSSSSSSIMCSSSSSTSSSYAKSPQPVRGVGVARISKLPSLTKLVLTSKHSLPSNITTSNNPNNNCNNTSSNTNNNGSNKRKRILAHASSMSCLTTRLLSTTTTMDTKTNSGSGRTSTTHVPAIITMSHERKLALCGFALQTPLLQQQGHQQQQLQQQQQQQQLANHHCSMGNLTTVATADKHRYQTKASMGSKTMITKQSNNKNSNATTTNSNNKIITESPAAYMKRAFQEWKISIQSTKDQPHFDPVTPERIQAYDRELLTLVRSQNLPQLRQWHKQSKLQHNINPCNAFGESLLHLACRKGMMNVVSFLVLEAQLSTNVQDDYGRTIWHDACWTVTPQWPLIEFLFEQCPHLLCLSDVRGHVPLDYVPKSDWSRWLEFLKDGKRMEQLKQRLMQYYHRQNDDMEIVVEDHVHNNNNNSNDEPARKHDDITLSATGEALSATTTTTTAAIAIPTPVSSLAADATIAAHQQLVLMKEGGRQ